MKWDVDKLQEAFDRQPAPDGKSWTYQKLAMVVGRGVGTVHAVINRGTGHKDSADAIARTLGFRNGRFDVQIVNRASRRKRRTA